MSKAVIVRFHEFCIQENSAPLNRLSGFMLGSSMVDLVDEFLNENYSSGEMALLESNPRNPKRSTITTDILESLKEKRELFPLMSKGILISTNGCKRLERNRFEISFNNPRIHGILDGGHNTLAIALFFLEKAGATDSEIRKVKRWADLPDVWNRYASTIGETKKSFEFLLPTEIIYPKTEAYDEVDFVSSIMEIAQARNNNTQLTEETKANKKGYYEAIKKYIDPNLHDKIEWRTNDGGRIKVREVIALSLIPLSRTGIGKDINPVHIYSSKAECVRTFERLMNAPGVSIPAHGDFIIEVVDKEILSALAMMNIMPELYDLLYEKLPQAYNESCEGKFGRISCVTMTSEENHKPAGKTRYYDRAVDYDYPDGFLVPLMYGLGELIQKNESGELYWICDPHDFIDDHLVDVMQSYGNLVIRMSNYDPQKAGKNRGSYAVGCMAVRDILMRKRVI